MAIANPITLETDWVDLYAASGITVGIQIRIQVLGPKTIIISDSAAEPVEGVDGHNKMRDDDWLINDIGDLGCWAKCEQVGGSSVAVSINPIV